MKNTITNENKNLTKSSQDKELSHSTFSGFNSGNFPAIDVRETEKEVNLTAEIPGLTDKEIQLTYQNGNLCICGEKKGGHENKTDNSYYSESWYGSFSRTIPLGSHLDWEKVVAKCHNGQLTVSIPKIEGVQSSSKKIDINQEVG
jgi:HSP20 family protein